MVAVTPVNPADATTADEVNDYVNEQLSQGIFSLMSIVFQNAIGDVGSAFNDDTRTPDATG